MKTLNHLRDTAVLESTLPEIEKLQQRKERAERACWLFVVAIIPVIVLSLRYEVGGVGLVLAVLGCVAGAFVSAFVWELSRLTIEAHIEVLKEKLTP